MLEWLAGVWYRVVSLFSSLWGILEWFLQYNYGYFANYINVSRPSLDDYHYNRKGSVQRYQANIEGAANHVLYSNYSRTNYVAVDGYFDLAEFRQQLIHSSRDWRYNFSPYLATIRGMDNGRMQYLLGHGKDTVRFLGNEVPAHVKEYIQNERSAVRHYKGVKSRVVTLVEGQTPSRLHNLAVSHWGGVMSVAVHHRQELEALAGRKNSLVELTNAGPLSRIFDLTGASYGSLKSVTAKHREIEGLTRAERLNKILDFTDRMYHDLNELTGNTSKAILDSVEDDFLSWFGNLLADYLLSEG